MKKILMSGAASAVILFGSVLPVFASTDMGHNTPHGVSSSTTLDACGYFVGTQTAVESFDSTQGGVTTHTEKGTWGQVLNNYGMTPVASLGTVKGSYSETYSIDASGNLSGVETFNSNAGSISQTFAFTPATGYSVTVDATRALSFLTSDTNGHCYTGPFPRP